MITNDNTKALNHRALMNGHTSRISVTTAVNPSSDTVICPAPEIVDEMHPAFYRPFRVQRVGALKTLNVMKRFRVTTPVLPKSVSPVADELPTAEQYRLGNDHLRDHMMSFVRRGILAT